MSLELSDNKRKRTIGFSFAWEGLWSGMRSEKNFIIHLIVAVLVVIAGFIFQLALVEWAIIVMTIGLVLIAEIFNTAVEKMIDYMKPEISPQAKVIKDIAAGGVLVSAFFSVIIGLIIFLSKLVEMCQ